MTTTLETHPEVDRYLAAVRAQLVDLPETDRDDLLAEVEASLHETAADGGSIEARLGPASEFAQELRAAAGYGRSRSPRVARLTALLRRASLAEVLPLWWAVRAYAVLAGLGFALGSWSFRHPAVPRIVDGPFTIALLAVLLVASFWIGRRERARVIAAIAVNLVLVAIAIPALWHAATARHVEYVVFQSPPLPSGLMYHGEPVSNIYPYSTDGQLLHDVLLYDGAGHAITIGGQSPDPNRRVLRSKSGKPILNAFPIRYFEPGTRRIAHPNAAPQRRR